jgi:general secretion pathway protein D
MKSRSSFRLGAVALAAVLLSATSQADVTLNLKDAEINTLISTVSEVTGKNFIIDPKVKGKVTVISAAPMNKQQLYDTFLAVLQVQGFAAVPAGNAIKIIQDSNARTDGGMPVRAGAGLPIDDVVTQVIQLQNVSAAQMVPILRPLMSPWAHLAAYPGNNSLIMADRAGNVARMNALIHQMDSGNDRDVESVPLENAAASEVVRILTQLIQQAKQSDPTAMTASVMADERSNAVLLGGDSGERERIKRLIQRLDTPLKDTEGNTQVVYLRYASAENLAPILEGYAQQVADSGKGGSGGASAAPVASSGSGGSAFDKTKVLADKDSNALVITAPPKTMRQIRSVIQQLDIQRRQVLVEAIIAEVSATKSSQLGLDFAAYNPRGGAISSILNSSTLSGLTSAATSVASGGSPLAALSVIGQGVTAGGVSIRNEGRSGTSFGVILRALQSDGDTNVLSTPNITTLDNQESEVSVGQEVPYLSGSYSSTGTSGSTTGVVNPFQTYQTKDVGLKLSVTPQINEGNTVKLKIKLESSNVASGSAGTASLVTNKRTISSVNNVESGQVLVIGGLIDDSVNDGQSRVPGLSSIPVLGNLFKSRSVTKTKRNLVVFIHPSIIRTQDEGDFYTAAKYNSVREAMMRVRDPVPLIGGHPPVLAPLDDYIRDNTPPHPVTLTPSVAVIPPPGASHVSPAPAPVPAPATTPTPSPAVAAPAPLPPPVVDRTGVPANVIVIPAQRPGQSGTDR